MTELVKPRSATTVRPPDFVEPIKAKLVESMRLNLHLLRVSLVIDPIQKFNKPLTVDPKRDLLILWIILRKFLIAAAESGLDIYPNLTVD